MDEIAFQDGAMFVRGWTADPDTTGPIDAHLYVDGVGVASVVADDTRDDVAAAYPAFGPDHGFEIPIAIAPGEHQVCVFGINVGAGGNTLLHCEDIVVSGASPFGGIDQILVEDGAIMVSGWTTDPDTTDPIDAHLYIDGVGVASDVADYTRDDVAAAYPAFGPDHGFEIPTAIAPGEHQVCVFGINVQAGVNTLLQCLYVNIPSRSPVGSMDEISVEDGVMTVSGWTTDPDTIDPIDAHLYVNNVGVANDVADHVRDDVAAAYPAYGPDHGYVLSTPIEPGEYQVCVFGINVGPGQSTLLHCEDIVVS